MDYNFFSVTEGGYESTWNFAVRKVPKILLVTILLQSRNWKILSRIYFKVGTCFKKIFP